MPERRVADGGDHDRAAAEGVGDRVALGARELVEARMLGIAHPAEREVDHACARADGVADRAGLDLGIDVAAADDAVVEQLHVRRPHADAADAVVGIGRDDPGDGGAVDQRRRRIVRLVDRPERERARQIGARAVDAAVDHRHRDRVVREHGQHVRVVEGVDRREVPLARRKRIGGRPRERARAHAQLGRERAEEAAGTAPADAPAPAGGAHGEAEAAVRARAGARDPPPAAADDVLQGHEPAGAGRKEPARQTRPGPPAEQGARVADDRHRGGRERLADEAVA